MTRKIIDLSTYLENEVVSDPPPFCPKNALADCLERRKSRKATLHTRSQDGCTAGNTPPVAASAVNSLPR